MPPRPIVNVKRLLSMVIAKIMCCIGRRSSQRVSSAIALNLALIYQLKYPSKQLKLKLELAKIMKRRSVTSAQPPHDIYDISIKQNL